MTLKAGTVTGATKTTAAKSQSLVSRRAKEKGLGGTDTGGLQVHRKWQPVQWSEMVIRDVRIILQELSQLVLGRHCARTALCSATSQGERKD